jgi:aldose 1-epimerase
MVKSWMARGVTLIALLAILSSCSEISKKSVSENGKDGMDIKKSPFGRTPDGKAVEQYTLTNSHGLEAKIITYGGIVTSLKVPDRTGRLGDIVLGHNTLDKYVEPNHAQSPYFGAMIGRYGNRIGKGQFTLDGKTYKLAINNGPNTLHGGNVGFDQRVWKAEPVVGKDEVALKLTYVSKDMEEGYPGTLKATVTYALTNKDELRIDYEATTDKPTVCNLTNHNYYNFTCAERDILGHELMINGDQTTPVDSGLIPTGELRSVEGTPFDFRKPKAMGQDINANDEQIKFGPGYDHNWVLRKKGSELSLAARVFEPTSGRVMEIYTTEPSIQFYTGNFLDGSITGKDGKIYKHRYGFCLETQHNPDSPNKPSWPSTVLRPGQVYKTTTLHKFSTR